MNPVAPDIMQNPMNVTIFDFPTQTGPGDAPAPQTGLSRRKQVQTNSPQYVMVINGKGCKTG